MAEAASEPQRAASSRFWNKTNVAYREAGDEANGVYTLRSGGRIFVISDLEGVGICIINAKSRGVVGTKSAEELRNGIFTESHSLAPLLADIITVSEDGKITFAGATPENPNPNNNMFCFLGDAWGIGPNNIELVRGLIDFKKENPNNTSLALGNRDILRGRITIETMLTAVSQRALIDAMKLFNKNPQDTKAIEAIKAVKIEFEYTAAAADVEPSYIDYLFSNSHEPDALDYGLIIEKAYATAVDRVDAISASMGEMNAWDFIVDEYLKMCGVNPCSVDRETKCKIYLHLVRVMSTEAAALQDNECHPDAKAFVNIYQDQLDASDLCAIVTMEVNREQAYFAHGTLVRKVVPTMPGTIFEFRLPKPSAQDPEPIISTPEPIISTPEITKTMMGRKDEEIRTELQNPGNSLTLTPTDGIKEININMKEYRKNPDPKYWLSFIAAANSQSTHLYYNKTPETNFTGVNHPITGSYGNTTMKQSGGRDRIHIKSLKRSTTGVDLGVKSITHYFAGHSPQGYIGACIKVADDGKYYVCVDVSKIDAQTYKNIDRYTCCCLIVEPIPKAEGGGGGGMKKRIIGRFVLENKYIMDQAHKSMLPEKCYVHYDHEINDDIDLTGRYIGLPELTYMTVAATRILKFSYIVKPNFEKEVTITSVNAEGGRGSSNGKAGGSRKKRSYKVKKRSSTRGRTRK
jgi:hypothetical protein